MNENVLISVIEPAYNVGRWLPACLDSILAQTYRNLEIIVIDDGSTDSTGEIVDEYSKKDSRIKAVHQQNAGLVMGREKGISLATGQYIAFVDGDDTIDPDIYERLLQNALQYDADISHCGVAFCFENGRIEPHYGTGEVILQDNFGGQKDLLAGEKIEPALWNKLYASHLMKDSCLDLNVLNNEDLLRNYILFYRAQRSVYEDFCGYRYLQRTGSMSKDSTKVIQSARHIGRARRLIVEHCIENNNEQILPYAMRSWLNCYVNAVNQMTFEKTPEAKDYCKECRELLKREKKNLHYLIKRQQLAAWLIIISPSIHRLVYKIYQRDRK